MATAIDPTSLFSIPYGLYVLTANDGKKDCGCIINTTMQLCQSPAIISVCVNKQNYTNEVIKEQGIFNVSVLTEDTAFQTFEHFGFQSGREMDKFAGRDDPRSENGLRYLDQSTNALFSAKVIDAYDYGTHTLFIAQLTQATKLSSTPSLTYSYYFAHIKPKPQPQPKRGYVCKICGYFHEGDELPADFICPICKHGAEDFEPVGF